MSSEPSRSPSILYNFGGAPAHGRALPPPLPALLTGGVALHSGALKPLTRGLLQRWGDGWLAQKPAIEMFCISAAASSFVAASQRMSACAGFTRDGAHVEGGSQFFCPARLSLCLDHCCMREEQPFQFFPNVLRLRPE